jgi:hypothetical protein
MKLLVTAKLQADVVAYTVHVINPVENKGYYYTPSQESCPPIVGGFFVKAELTRLLTFFFASLLEY